MFVPGVAHNRAMSEGSTERDRGEPAGPDLNELRSRLAALHGSVEQLGREGEPPGAASAGDPHAHPAPPPPADPYPHPAPPPGTDPYAPPEPAPGQPPFQPAPEPETAYPPPPPPAPPPYEPYELPPPSAPAYTYQPPTPPPVPSEPAYQPAPAATNGQGETETVAAHVAILDVGPFADLIELRHFEEAVGRLEIVRDVRVRRFGHGRAFVELALDGPYAVGRELYRLGRPMRVEPGPEGEIVVDFTDVLPQEPGAEEPGAADGAGGAGGDDRGPEADAGEGV